MGCNVEENERETRRRSKKEQVIQEIQKMWASAQSGKLSGKIMIVLDFNQGGYRRGRVSVDREI